MSGSAGKKFKMTYHTAFLFFTLLFIAAEPLPALAGDYQIGEGDTLMVSVWGEKELSLSVKVRPDGKITLPALGEIMAAGQTPNELQTDLQKKLRGIVKNPVVTVIVVEVTNNKVYVFGGGVTAMAIGMILMGFLGTPRRHWDSSFAGAPFPVEISPASELVQVLFGVGGLLAAVGALMFIAIAVATVFFGKPVTAEAIAQRAPGTPQGVLKLPNQVHSGPAADELHKSGVKGTIVLVAVFFVCFIVYYFTNWKMLSFLWKVG